MKKKFLKETSLLKRSGLIFLFCKIYFTDDVAIKLKLRVTGEEWDIFKKFLNDIEDNESFLDIRLMVFHLFTENFFRFTIKNKRLALDFGSPNNHPEAIDPTKSRAFWSDIQEEILKMEYTDIVELKQLAQIHNEAQKPLEHLLPEKVSIDEALEGFEALKECINKISFESPKKSRKEIIDSCRDYINTQQNLASDNVLVIDEGLESDTDDVSKKSRKSKSKRKRDARKALKRKENPLGDSEEDNHKTGRKLLGMQSQKNILSAFDGSAAEIKKVYE